MNIKLLGTSYLFTHIKEFESVYIDKHSVSEFLNSTQWVYVQEIVILSTCNRFECYIVSNDLDKAENELCTAISVFNSIPLETVISLMSSFNSVDPVEHLYKVASGIESMVFGENEILTQVKDAQQTAYKLSYSGSILNKVFQSAVATGKKVRSETDISKGAYSVSSIAIEAIRERLYDYFDCRILIIGMGTMGIRSLKKLYALGHPNITVTNRSPEKLVQLTSEYDISSVSYADALASLSDFDIVITATASKVPIITAATFGAGASPKLIVDLGVPRNVDLDREDTFVVTVRGLKDIADKNISKRKTSLVQVNQIIDDELLKLKQWYDYKLTCLDS